jgi:hypothetical protein
MSVNGNSFAKLWLGVGQCGFANVLPYTLVLILNFLCEGKVMVSGTEVKCHDLSM